MKIIGIASFFCLFLAAALVYWHEPAREHTNIQTELSLFSAPLPPTANPYQNFDAPAALNAIAAIENRHFWQYKDSLSPYYGTIWREEVDTITWLRFAEAVAMQGERPDSMHCTIYAVRALKAGLGDEWDRLDSLHRVHWGKREHAGWSIGYLLTRYYGWKAWLVIDSTSREFAQCKKSFARQKDYPVWRQPDIPLEDMYIKGKDDAEIETLLANQTFGWGFSYQGIHTWITRFGALKECNWVGAPAREFEAAWGYSPLFIRTPFLDYNAYLSHVVIFPPKKNPAEPRPNP
ncbi:MAG: hypothetical protein AAF206_27965 [Bacteroidota bacterium]